MSLRKTILIFLIAAGCSTGPLVHARTPDPAPSPAPVSAPAAAPLPLPAQDGDIRDIRGPVHIPNPWLTALWAAAALAALGAGWFAWRVWAKRARNARKLPHEIALERLRHALAFLEAGQPGPFSIAVSGAIRGYIEERYRVQAAHRTTEEFLHDLAHGESSPLSGYSDLLKDFLSHCDLAKFARWSLSREQMQSMHASAVRFVSETKPEPRPEQARGIPPIPVPASAASQGGRP